MSFHALLRRGAVAALALGLLAVPSFAEPSLMDPASLNEQAPATYKAKFTTTKGEFVIEVTRDWAPIGADRFYNLVKNGYYDAAHVFRVVPNFVVQWGMHAKPEVTQVWKTAQIRDEPVKESNKAGYITFAKTNAPNSRTTQVFINLKDNGRLDGMGFAPFGKVVEGMDVVKQFYGGYGDRTGPSQARITKEGKAYLDANFPKLDAMIRAEIVAAPKGE